MRFSAALSVLFVLMAMTHALTLNKHGGEAHASSKHTAKKSKAKKAVSQKTPSATKKSHKDAPGAAKKSHKKNRHTTTLVQAMQHEEDFGTTGGGGEEPQQAGPAPGAPPAARPASGGGAAAAVWSGEINRYGPCLRDFASLVSNNECAQEKLGDVEYFLNTVDHEEHTLSAGYKTGMARKGMVIEGIGMNASSSEATPLTRHAFQRSRVELAYACAPAGSECKSYMTPVNEIDSSIGKDKECPTKLMQGGTDPAMRGRFVQIVHAYSTNSEAYFWGNSREYAAAVAVCFYVRTYGNGGTNSAPPGMLLKENIYSPAPAGIVVSLEEEATNDDLASPAQGQGVSTADPDLEMLHKFSPMTGHSILEDKDDLIAKFMDDVANAEKNVKATPGYWDETNEAWVPNSPSLPFAWFEEKGLKMPHGGNLLEHSKWTALKLGRWCQDGGGDLDERLSAQKGINPFAIGLNCDLAMLGAFLHDIGKGGDCAWECLCVKATGDPEPLTVPPEVPVSAAECATKGGKLECFQSAYSKHKYGCTGVEGMHPKYGGWVLSGKAPFFTKCPAPEQYAQWEIEMARSATLEDDDVSGKCSGPGDCVRLSQDTKALCLSRGYDTSNPSKSLCTWSGGTEEDDKVVCTVRKANIDNRFDEASMNYSHFMKSDGSADTEKYKAFMDKLDMHKYEDDFQEFSECDLCAQTINLGKPCSLENRAMTQTGYKQGTVEDKGDRICHKDHTTGEGSCLTSACDKIATWTDTQGAKMDVAGRLEAVLTQVAGEYISTHPVLFNQYQGSVTPHLVGALQKVLQVVLEMHWELGRLNMFTRDGNFRRESEWSDPQTWVVKFLRTLAAHGLDPMPSIEEFLTKYPQAASLEEHPTEDIVDIMESADDLHTPITGGGWQILRQARAVAAGDIAGGMPPDVPPPKAGTSPTMKTTVSGKCSGPGDCVRSSQDTKVLCLSRGYDTSNPSKSLCTWSGGTAPLTPARFLCDTKDMSSPIGRAICLAGCPQQCKDQLEGGAPSETDCASLCHLKSNYPSKNIYSLYNFDMRQDLISNLVGMTYRALVSRDFMGALINKKALNG